MSVLLGLDLGDHRIGVAVADSATGMVKPLVTLRRATPGDDAASIVRICEERGASELVVGLPLHMNGDESDQSRRTRDWIASVTPLMLLVLGSIEIADMVFLRESLAAASYEGVRTAAKYDSQTDEVVAKTQFLLNARDVKEPTVTVNPPQVSSAVKGDLVTVTVTAPCNLNSVLPLQFLTGQNITFQATMVRE